MQNARTYKSNWRFRTVSTLLIACFFASFPIHAQRFTYLGVGMSLYTADMKPGLNFLFTKAPYSLNGGAYDVTLRQEINEFLSLETGISAHNFEYNYLFNKEIYMHIGAFPVHKIPLKAELEVDVFRDRIAAYASFGYQFCIPFDTGNHGMTSYSSVSGIEGSVGVEWNYIPDRWFYSLYQVGAGLRFRLVDALLFELELGYGFSLNDLIKATFTYLDQTGEEIIYMHKEGLNYWYMQFGFSYPIQKVMQGIKNIIE